MKTSRCSTDLTRSALFPADLTRSALLVAGGLAIVMAVLSTTAAPLAAQAPTTGAGRYAAPKTPWGDPDLQGVWSNWDETPFQAPDPLNRERVRPPVDPRVGEKTDSPEAWRRSISVPSALAGLAPWS